MSGGKQSEDELKNDEMYNLVSPIMYYVELKFSLVICFIPKQMFRLLYSSLHQCMQKLQNKTNIKYNLNTVYSYGSQLYGLNFLQLYGLLYGLR